MGYVLYARYQQDLPIPKIKTSLHDLYSFELSEGEIVAQLEEARELFGEDYDAITTLIKDAPAVHADEAGFRVMGENWWLWVGVTPEGITKFTLHHSRGKGAADCLLGNNPNQVRTTDFFGSYAHLPGPWQVCWVHLLRAVKEEDQHFHQDISALYTTLKAELTKPLSERDTSQIATRLTEIQETDYGEEKAILTLQERLRKFHDQLLTCLHFEGVAPENNKAERTLRPQVIKRKIFGSIRSIDGAITHETNSSVIATYLSLTKGSFFDIIQPVLQARLDST
jgi:hypothetical protein